MGSSTVYRSCCSGSQRGPSPGEPLKKDATDRFDSHLSIELPETKEAAKMHGRGRFSGPRRDRRETIMKRLEGK